MSFMGASPAKKPSGYQRGDDAEDEDCEDDDSEWRHHGEEGCEAGEVGHYRVLNFVFTEISQATPAINQVMAIVNSSLAL